MDLKKEPLNVLGTALEPCCGRYRTGFFRDGFCKTDPTDRGRHVICSRVTQEFLDFSLARGNDLITPRLEFDFPGLKAGDCWCLCASRWKEALQAGVAPPVNLLATHQSALEIVSIGDLKTHGELT
ncbi:MAG: DUF2237 domain-containing protein [Proteobacteria bacterium]|nr:DUF2237 domain-containing protein [Pseudomonadota bacterium]